MTETDHELDNPNRGGLVTRAAVLSRKVKWVKRWQPYRLVFYECSLQGVSQVQRIFKQNQAGLLSPIVAITMISVVYKKTR